MKNMYLTFVSLLILLSTLGVKAQNSITLSFNSTSNIDSVRIENLDNASYKVLKDGTFSILLQFGLPNKIESIHVFDEPLVYPNPFKQQVNFEFSSVNQNNVNLAVYDLSGKVVAQFNQKIDVGSHRFTFRPAKPGVYLMKVSDNSNVYTARIICKESSTDQSVIEYAGLMDTPKNNNAMMVRANAPNSSTGFSANTGDLLRFTGYAGTKINSVYDFANSTKNYTFTFADRYFKFKNYTIQASKPSFVDIMFSVTDENNKGVDYLTNSDFTVLEDDAPTSPSETFRYVRKMQQIPSKIKTVLLLDNSTSVSADIEAIKNAAIKFVQTIREGQEIAIYVFSDTPVLLQNFTTNKNLLETAIKGIGSGYPSTNLYGSIITGLSIWKDVYTLPSITQGSLIVYTDGSDTQGSSTLNSVISSRGDKMIYVIGLGNEINPTALDQIANPGPYYPIQKAGELDAVFAAIQSDIVQFSNSFYWLNYMSPKRTGTHTLKVSAANNTNTTSTSYLTGSFSAAGFQSVKSGVYTNIDDNHLYGLDTIRCFYYPGGYSFIYDASNLTPYSKDSLVLKPVTYWAFKPPVFTWSLDNTTAYQTTISAYSQLSIKPVEAKKDTSFITLNDEANNYTKKFIVIFNPLYAEVKTANPFGITYSNFILKGEVTNIGGSAVTERGFCFSTTPNPTISNSVLFERAGLGVIFAQVIGVTPNTTYYVRAYAKNSSGISYGNEITLKTLNKPVLTTSNIEYLTQSTVKCGGNIISDGGDPINARGVCWGTTTNPTINNNKTVDGNGLGVFSSSITGLTVGTTYYVRSYATNNGGTTYGNEISFTMTLPTVSTSPVTSVMALSATGGGNVTATGSTGVIARGVCWSTTPNPTIALSTKTVDGTGTGNFVSYLTGLTPTTKYYIRAYATNSIGTAYGAEISFTTQSGLASLTTTGPYDISTAAATGGGSISADGGYPIITRGVCWSTSPNPTISLSSKTNNGSGIGTFASAMTGLIKETTYYVRAYAVNSVGASYGNEVKVKTYSGEVKDIDGNIYFTVKIGNQMWMAENLKTTRYRNGELIGTTIPATKYIGGDSAPKYQWAFNGDESYVAKYGRLYTWYAVTDTRNIAPEGWHVPTSYEWTILKDYLIANGYNYDGTTTGNQIAKSLAATTDWVTNSGTGTIGNDLSKNNSSGFTALPGGNRGSNDTFGSIGYYGIWWSSTKNGYDYANACSLGNAFAILDVGSAYFTAGFSVRCVKD